MTQDGIERFSVVRYKGQLAHMLVLDVFINYVRYEMLNGWTSLALRSEVEVVRNPVNIVFKIKRSP